MQRIALGIEYDGSRYFGWQRQKKRTSVQESLETAISKVANHPILTYCAGRTDAGVHASNQVIHFDSEADRAPIAWVRGVNSYLPPDIRVCWMQPVSADFDARKSALSRRYCYIIVNRAVSPGILRHGVTWILPTLDVDAMQSGAQYLLGKHDFSSFRGAHCQAKTPIRTISAVQFHRLGDNIILDITANAFLYHMVRNIVGSLLMVGQGKCPDTWIKGVLAAKDRRAAGLTAPPQGLYLVDVRYPDNFGLLEPIRMPWFFPSPVLTT
ncbi:MAG TPA: tRNA pseudouridine(38-40) synthase TruA [Candidatus Berkiella sp.]|nr:tRNA pseudouridine(38-40) synthase TruA [Candidatus Berkiella sp.]